MCKLLTLNIFLILITCSTSQASYRMVIGLENDSGGILPNDSIVFKGNSTAPTNPTEPVDDYSIFGSYEAVARDIVNNPNPVTKVTYSDVKDIFNSGYDLNEYKTLQSAGYGYGLLAQYVWSTDLNLSNLIALHQEGYNLIRLGQAANYVQETYGMALNTGVHKITSSYKASCWNDLDEVFMQINIENWDTYAAQQNCLK